MVKVGWLDFLRKPAHVRYAAHLSFQAEQLLSKMDQILDSNYMITSALLYRENITKTKNGPVFNHQDPIICAHTSALSANKENNTRASEN